jgi:hypothetical protein
VWYKRHVEAPRDVEVRPEPPEGERDAIVAALEATREPGLDAWTRAALREATERDPRL